MRNKNIGEKIRWIVAFGLIIILGISILALANPKCMFHHDYVNGVCADCGNVCEHKAFNKDDECKACGMTKAAIEESKQQTPEPAETTETGSLAA